MTQRIDRPITQTPYIQIRNAYIELSEEGTRRFVKFIPRPWIIWAVGALVTWITVGIAAFAIHTKLTSDYSCYASYATNTCQTQCGDAYFVLFTTSALFVTVVGTIFQGIAILWHTSRLSLNHAAILFVVWGLFFQLVYIGNPFMSQVDMQSWSSCMNPVLSTIGVVANLALIFIIPLVVSAALAVAVSNRVWRGARAQAADFSQVQLLYTSSTQSSGQNVTVKCLVVIALLFLRGAVGIFQVTDLFMAMRDSAGMYPTWAPVVVYISAAVCVSSMLAAVLMLRGKRNGLILAGSALAVELVLSVVISIASNTLPAIIIPAILLIFVYSFYKREPERSWFS